MAGYFDASFYFYYPNQGYHTFSENYLTNQCTFKINYLKKGFTVFNRFFFWGVSELLKREKPDIILCCEFSPVTLYVFLNRWFFGKKFRLYTLCDDSPENTKKRKGYRLFVSRLISKNIDGVIFPSKTTGNIFNQYVAEKASALELPIIQSDERFRNQLKQSLDLSNNYIEEYQLINTKIILYVGRLDQEKNLTILLAAFSRLRLEHTTSVLFIIGTGRLEASLKREVDVLGQSMDIRFLGRKEGLELFAWYNIGQLFVLPSTFEPYGAVVNEALLSGCKVLCSKLAGASTLINRSNGMLFDPYDIDELQDKMSILLNDTAPIESPLKEVRGNYMPFSFNEKVNNLLSAL
ncbi:glycosyltransferase family 4 protein [Ulvibacterium sp.]|uniref:glycosyltransferase family 4 protein n=1 Tax=Ulvibacterium sp. TaxID=2665914 RepID=UPI0026037200|nr:glycosyltransferase family 4 protein [Ulvibacterium sp.]